MNYYDEIKDGNTIIDEYSKKLVIEVGKKYNRIAKENHLSQRQLQDRIKSDDRIIAREYELV